MKKLSFLVLFIFITNTIYSQVKHSNTPSKKSVQKTSTKYAALAIDRKNGFYYGWANDQTDLEAAEKNALNECIKKGGNCSIVINFSGAGCGVYKTVEGSGTGYGWGVAKTKEAADAIATKECLLRSDGNVPTNSVWGCNASNSGVLKGIFNALSEIKLEEEQRKIDDAIKLQEKAIADEKAKILQKAKNECKEEYKNRYEKAKKYYEQCDYKNRQANYDKDTYGEEGSRIWNTKAYYAEKDMDHIHFRTPCDRLDDEAYLVIFNKDEKEYFDKSRNDLEESLEKISENARRQEDSAQTYEAPKLMSITEQFGNLEKIMQDSQKQIAANQATRTATSSTRNAPARREYDTTVNTNSNGYSSKIPTLSKQSESKGNNNNIDDCSGITPIPGFREEKDDSTYKAYHEYELTCSNESNAKRKLEVYKATIINFHKSKCSQCEIVFEPCNCRKLSNNDSSCTLKYAVISKITHVKQVDKGYSEGISK